MSRHYVLPLHLCTDSRLVGGKAAGLARLIRMGISVPPGCCLTVEAELDALRAIGLDADAAWTALLAASPSDRVTMLQDVERRLDRLSLPPPAQAELEQGLRSLSQNRPAAPIRWWAVRSSATDEDGHRRSQAGAYRTVLAVTREQLLLAIRRVWASLWTDSALTRAGRRGRPRMAVLIQPMIAAQAAGVAFSRHPVTGDPDLVVINAVAGLSDALVGGAVTPDAYVVRVGPTGATPRLLHRVRGASAASRVMTEQGLVEQPSAPSTGALSDEQALQLASLATQIQQGIGGAVDIEWAHDGTTCWLLQARPVTAQPTQSLSDATSTWSRANFKETMPELPTPLGLSFLESFMEHGILRHYRNLGCIVPGDTSSVRIIAGRPFINVSLFQSFTTQLWGNPHQVTEQMGGEGAPLLHGPPPLPWWKVLRGGLLMERHIRQAARRAPSWFQEMKAMAQASESASQAACAPAALIDQLHQIDRRLQEQDLTFAIVGAVSQAFFALGLLLERRVGPDWRALLNASLQGSGAVISANQIHRLASLVETARADATTRTFFSEEPWMPGGFRTALGGTAFLNEFDGYLADYGHRALSESDVGSPRFAEMPEYLLGVIRAQVRQGAGDEIHRRADGPPSARQAAWDELRRRFGWRRHEWAYFRWWHRRLDRFLALREANRHHLMYFSLAARRLELALADRFVDGGRLQTREDIFLLRPEEIHALAAGQPFDVTERIRQRTEERARWRTLSVPDVVRGLGELTDLDRHGTTGTDPGGSDGTWHGLPIGTGVIEGPVRLIRGLEDLAQVRPGEILVTTVLDPGLAPVFGMVAGLVTEMGGVLSHGAIIAREYGLPTVANIPGITTCLCDGERIRVDGGRGEVRRLKRPPATGGD